MVEEVRKILLNRDELLAAIGEYRRVTGEFMPNGTILGCSSPTPSTLKIGLDALYGSVTEITLDDKAVLEPVIKYCIDNKIVLPRTARKVLRFEGDKAALHIFIGNPSLPAL